MAAGNQQKHLLLSFATEQKHSSLVDVAGMYEASTHGWFYSSSRRGKNSDW